MWNSSTKARSKQKVLSLVKTLCFESDITVISHVTALSVESGFNLISQVISHHVKITWKSRVGRKLGSLRIRNLRQCVCMALHDVSLREFYILGFCDTM